MRTRAYVIRSLSLSLSLSLASCLYLSILAMYNQLYTRVTLNLEIVSRTLITKDVEMDCA